MTTKHKSEPATSAASDPKPAVVTTEGVEPSPKVEAKAGPDKPPSVVETDNEASVNNSCEDPTPIPQDTSSEESMASDHEDAFVPPPRRFGADVVFKKTKELKAHPKNKEIYGEELNPDLTDNIRKYGILQPILVLPDGTIVAGHGRWRSAIELGIDEVPVVIFDSTDELEIEAALVSSNKSRPRDNVMLGREAKLLLEIEEKLARRRMATKSAQGVQKVSQGEAGKARDKVGEKLGVSGVTAQHLVEATEVIATLKKEGKTEDAAEVETALQKSVSKGHKAAKAKGAIKGKRTTTKSKKKEVQRPEIGVGADGEAHETAINAADDVLTFLRGREAAKLNDSQKTQWQKVGDQIAKFLAEVGIKISAK